MKQHNNESTKTGNWELTVKNLSNFLEKNTDIRFRNITINGKVKVPVTLLYIEGLVSITYINDYILKPLIEYEGLSDIKGEADVIDFIDNGGVYFLPQLKTYDIRLVIEKIIEGNTALILDESKAAFLFDTKSPERRSITETSSEFITKGSKDSFIESLVVNTATIRQRIKWPNLVIEEIVVGKLTKTQIAVIYIEGLTNKQLIEKVKERISSLNIDNVLSTSFIEEFISDNINSVFPQLFTTERPDKFCSEIVEGRVGIMIDGIPFSLIAPGTMVQFMQASDDYSHNYIIGSAIRFLRFSMLLVSLLLPCLYIAVTTFHPEMFPTALTIAIARSRADVPFPVFAETLIMLVSFEVLFEAGLRIPKPIGQAVSIIGTLVIGQAAVDAKIVSPAVIIIIAFAGIASFTIPNQDLSNAIRLWRFIIAVLGSIIGVFGLILGFIILTNHLCSLETFGIPYLSPFVAGEDDDRFSDSLFRLPLKRNKFRPKDSQTMNVKRQGD